VSRKDKLGYPTPFDKWIKGILKDYILDTLLGNNALIYSYLDKKQLTDNLNSHFSGRKDFSWDIWRFLSLENIIKVYNSMKLK
jgi:hypothetical protein